MRIVDEIEGLIGRRVAALQTLLDMIGLELKLARLSFMPFLLQAMIFFPLALATWLILVMTFVYGVWHYTHSWLIGLLTALGIHVCLLGLVGRLLLKNVSNMSFKFTRKYLHEQGHTHHELEKKNHRRARRTRSTTA